MLMVASGFESKDVIVAFCADPLKSSVRPLGQGNINDTYLVQSAGFSFVLQRISSAVFPDPPGVIANFQKVSTHLATKTCKGLSSIKFSSPVLTQSGELFYRDPRGDYWRGQSYIPHTNIRKITDVQQAYQVGFVLAAFHSFVADLNIEELEDPLPGFHNLERYLAEFDQERDRCNTDFRVSEGDYCLGRVVAYRELASIFHTAKSKGILKLQAIHGDPKVDNFLFDESGEAFGLIDLDTVGVGFSHLDLGDCLRSCCNTAGESGTDAAHFDMDIFRAILKGYFSWPDNFFSKEQYRFVYDAVLQISFELGLRFFTDYLRGNVYFRVSHAGENLSRAVRQFQVTDDIRRRESELRDIIRSVCKL